MRFNRLKLAPLLRGLACAVVLCWLFVDPSTASARPAKHRVYAGQTLGRIAKRYNVSVDALCAANLLDPHKPIRPGQLLVVPDPGAKTRPAKSTTERTKPAAKTAPPRAKRTTRQAKGGSWRKYRRPARRAGYVKLRATGRSWQGYAIVKGNLLAGRAKTGFQRTLYSWRTGGEKAIDPKLIRLLTRVSDTFGGRRLHVASGYREHSHAKESKHKLGHACDFSVEGVPNEALRDFLLTLPGVGVGYYPNSTFVHLDVRQRKTQWTDYSRAGQAPRYAHKR